MFTEEQYRVIGDPSESGVQEAVWLAIDRHNCPVVLTEQVAEILVAMHGIAEDEAHRRIQRAVTDGAVEVQMWPSLLATLTLDPLTCLRLERRVWFWRLADEARQIVPAHFPNECVIVRAAITNWNDDYAEPPGDTDLLHTVRNLIGYRDDLTALHAVLNAVDAGAVRAAPEHEGSRDLRFYVVDGWTQDAGFVS